MTLLLVWLLACGGSAPDPELVAQRAALDAWEAGVAQLDEGDAEAARASFERARKQLPGDPVLAAWEAKAVAETGDLQGAVELLEPVVQRFPEQSWARYQLASWLARLGRPDAAAQHLARALEDGARPPREVLEDPDFQPWLDHEAFAFLPSERLMVALEGPEGPVFLGSELQVRLRVVGAGDGPVTVHNEGAPGAVTLVSVLEDETVSTAGPFRDLTWTFRAVGGGSSTLGPFEIRSEPHASTAAAIEIQTLAPPGREGESGWLPERVFASPTELAVGRRAPAAWRHDADLLVLVPPDEAVLVDGKREAGVRYERRERGQTQWVLWRFPGRAGASVALKGNGEPIPLSVDGD